MRMAAALTVMAALAGSGTAAAAELGLTLAGGPFLNVPAGGGVLINPELLPTLQFGEGWQWVPSLSTTLRGSLAAPSGGPMDVASPLGPTGPSSTLCCRPRGSGALLGANATAQQGDSVAVLTTNRAGNLRPLVVPRGALR